MRDRLRGGWLLCNLFLALSLAALCRVGPYLFPGPVEFTPRRWEDGFLRCRMVDSLTSRYELRGMTRAQVEELLGPGCETAGSDGIAYQLSYRFGDAVGDPVGQMELYFSGEDVCRGYGAWLRDGAGEDYIWPDHWLYRTEETP